MPSHFQLGLLPERKIDRRALATGYGFIIFLIIVLVNIGLIWPERLSLASRYHVTELIPVPSLRPEPKISTPLVEQAKRLPRAPVFAAPKLIVPREVRTARPQPREVEPPKVVINRFAPPAVLKQTSAARPLLAVRTSTFGSSLVPTINAPTQKVQTGGFGDSNGVKGQGKPNAPLTIANTGSFDLPQGSGTGNGAGGATGAKGTVANAGFGNGMAVGSQGDGRSNGRGSVQTGGFGTQQVGPSSPKAQQADSGPATTPVEITFKPNPVYTEEARQLKLEGEVLLQVMFSANGQLHVNRVVGGLGHGLDESAIAATNKMRFKPAMRYGTPMDSTAVVHVVFQLAF